MKYLLALSLLVAGCNTNADTQPKIFDSAKSDGTVAVDTAVTKGTIQAQ